MGAFTCKDCTFYVQHCAVSRCNRFSATSCGHCSNKYVRTKNKPPAHPACKHFLLFTNKANQDAQRNSLIAVLEKVHDALEKILYVLNTEPQ
ncbi:MAG: hypothetical protein FWH03_02450 [Firmicutes bacterium]|nr:hypothetical protein [Bacillota bacterium]